MPNPIPNLAEQFHAYRNETGVVVTIQRWTGFRGGRHAFVLVTNDTVTTQRACAPGQANDFYRTATAQLAGEVVTTDQARDRLERAGLPRQRQCSACDAKLPIGGLYCTTCGTNQLVCQ